MAPASRQRRGGVGGDAAVDLEPDRAVADHGAERAELRQHRRQEGLAAEAGVDGHHQDEVALVEDVLDRGGRRRGVERHAGLRAELADAREAAVEVGAGLGVDGDDVGAGGDEGLEEGVGGRDHQVDVERGPRAGAERRDHVGAEGDVGDEMAVHHVDLHPVGAGGLDRGHLLAEAGEVGREDGRDDRRLPREGGRLTVSRRIRLEVSLRPPPIACTSL